jgi:hypothetical protein
MGEIATPTEVQQQQLPDEEELAYKQLMKRVPLADDFGAFLSHVNAHAEEFLQLSARTHDALHRQLALGLRLFVHIDADPAAWELFAVSGGARRPRNVSRCWPQSNLSSEQRASAIGRSPVVMPLGSRGWRRRERGRTKS